MRTNTVFYTWCSLLVIAAMQLNGCFPSIITNLETTPPPILLAISRSDTTEVKHLIDSSADAVNDPWFAGMHSPLGVSPNGWMTDWLIAHGADVNLKLADGSIPLTEVASRETDASDVIAAMVKHGAKVNNANDKGYPSRAARERELSRNLYTTPGMRSYSAPTVSVKKGGVDMAQFFLEGKTPLHSAALAGVATNVRALVKNGAIVDATEGDDKLTALHVACAMVNTEAAEALVELGANINAKDDDDETPLKLCTASESTRDKTALIAYLKAHGAKE